MLKKIGGYTMRLSEILPQPFRNIYQNYQLLNNPEITQENRVDTIQKISKDCFRLLLILPLIVCVKSLFEGSVKTEPFLWGLCIPICVFPATTMLLTAGTSGCLSIAMLIHAIAAKSAKSLEYAGVSITFGLIAAFYSEQYEIFESLSFNMENPIITPLSNRMARVFI
jgi:hypothetical protein